MEQEIKIIVLVNGDLLISAVEEVAALDLSLIHISEPTRPY